MRIIQPIRESPAVSVRIGFNTHKFSILTFQWSPSRSIPIVVSLCSDKLILMIVNSLRISCISNVNQCSCLMMIIICFCCNLRKGNFRRNKAIYDFCIIRATFNFQCRIGSFCIDTYSSAIILRKT